MKQGEELVLKHFNDSWYSSTEEPTIEKVSANGVAYTFICIRFRSSSDDLRYTIDDISAMIADTDEFFYYITQFSFVQFVLGDSMNQSLSKTSEKLNAHLASSYGWNLNDVPQFLSNFPNKSIGDHLYMVVAPSDLGQDKMVVANDWGSIILDNPDDEGDAPGELLHYDEDAGYYKAFTIAPAGGYKISFEGDEITIDLLLHMGVDRYPRNVPIPDKVIVHQSFSTVYKIDMESDPTKALDHLDVKLNILRQAQSGPTFQSITTPINIAYDLLMFIASQGLNVVLGEFIPQELIRVIKLIRYAIKLGELVQEQGSRRGFVELLKLDRQFKNDFVIPLETSKKFKVTNMKIHKGWTISGQCVDKLG